MTSPRPRRCLKTKALAEQYNVRTAVSFSDPGMVKFFGTIWPPWFEVASSSFSVMRQRRWSGGMRSPGQAIDAIKAVARRFVLHWRTGRVTWDGENLHRVAAKPVEAVNTNGAGDMFAGAFSTRFPEARAI
ncbi:MAG: hypothetical protein CM15mP89_3890 [Gammaproteobacteria bacterium]|nr:MAG: hypothetical protein CM15mP89_3890 [Gammaproteobacteria bacterium]